MPHVLIVDDEPDILKLLGYSFTSAGYTAAITASAAEAIELLGSLKYDVILSDMSMKGMDGHALARWVSEHCPTPFIMMTGYLKDFLDCDTCPLRQHCYVLEKPFMPGEAIKMVNGILSQS